MGAIKCAECGRTVSTSVKRCPHCGAKKKHFYKKDHKVGLYIVLGIVGLAVFNAITNGVSTAGGHESNSIKPNNVGWKAKGTDELCSLLVQKGFKTNGWRQYYENEYGCNTPYHEIGKGYPLKNNLAYYVEGEKLSAKKLYIVLNVNNKKDESLAVSSFEKLANSLSSRVLGVGLPDSIRNAIHSEKSTTVSLRNSTVEVNRQNWENGNGYEMKFIIH